MNMGVLLTVAAALALFVFLVLFVWLFLVPDNMTTPAMDRAFGYLFLGLVVFAICLFTACFAVAGLADVPFWRKAFAAIVYAWAVRHLWRVIPTIQKIIGEIE